MYNGWTENPDVTAARMERHRLAMEEIERQEMDLLWERIEARRIAASFVFVAPPLPGAESDLCPCGADIPLLERERGETVCGGCR